MVPLTEDEEGLGQTIVEAALAGLADLDGRAAMAASDVPEVRFAVEGEVLAEVVALVQAEAVVSVLAEAVVSVLAEVVVSVLGEAVVSVPGEAVVSVPGEAVVSVLAEVVVSVLAEVVVLVLAEVVVLVLAEVVVLVLAEVVVSVLAEVVVSVLAEVVVSGQAVAVAESVECSAKYTDFHDRPYREGKPLDLALGEEEPAEGVGSSPTYTDRGLDCTRFPLGSKPVVAQGVAEEEGVGVDDIRRMLHDSGRSRFPASNISGGSNTPRRSGRGSNRIAFRMDTSFVAEHHGIRRSEDRRLRRTHSARRRAHIGNSCSYSRTPGGRRRSFVRSDRGKSRSARCTNRSDDRLEHSPSRNNRNARRSYTCTADERSAVRKCRRSSSADSVRHKTERKSRGTDQNNIRKNRRRSVAVRGTARRYSPKARSRFPLDTNFPGSREHSIRGPYRNSIRPGSSEFLPRFLRREHTGGGSRRLDRFAPSSQRKRLPPLRSFHAPRSFSQSMKHLSCSQESFVLRVRQRYSRGLKRRSFR